MKTLLSFSLLLLVLALAGSELFRDGRSEWSIWLPERPSPVESYAADELTHILHQISGATLPVKSGDASGVNRIIVGTPATSPEIRKHADALGLNQGGEQRWAVRTLNGNLYLAGKTEYGIMPAVYTFLRDALGCRWFWADADGAYLPQRKHFTMPELNQSGEPSVAYRGFHFCQGTDDRQERWLGRNFGNMIRDGVAGGPEWIKNRVARGYYIYYSGHNIVLPDQDAFAKHPEWFALDNGQRKITQLCWSNPEVDALMAEKFTRLLEKNPAIKILGFYPEDNRDYCRCPKCVKMDVSTAWFSFLRRLSDTLKQRFPQMRFASIAYQGYIDVPKCDVGGYEFIEYAMYDRCYVHPVGGNCEISNDSGNRMREWGKRSPLGVYAYEFDIFTPTEMVPFYTMLSRQAKFFKQNGIKMVLTETNNPDYPRHKPRTERKAHQMRLAHYLYPQLLWNPDADVEALIADFCTYVYPSAPEAMTAYHKLMDRAWSDQAQHFSVYGNDPMPAAEIFTPARTEELLKLLKLADEQARRKPDSPARTRELAALQFERELLSRHLGNALRTANHILTVPRQTPVQWEGVVALSWPEPGELRGALLRSGCREAVLYAPDGSSQSVALGDGQKAFVLRDSFKAGEMRRLELKFDSDQTVTIPLSFADIPQITRSVLLLASPGERPKRNTPKVQKQLLAANWQVRLYPAGRYPSSSELSKTRMVVMRLEAWKGVPNAFWGELKRFVQGGGIVVMGARGEIPFETLFGGKRFGLKWTGEQHYFWKQRMTQSMVPGKWQSEPTDLKKHLEMLCTPVSGYEIPGGSDWKMMAEMRKKDGTRAPYLLEMRYGKGMMYLTTGSLGQDDDGMWMTFGSSHIDSVIALLNNLEGHATKLQ